MNERERCLAALRFGQPDRVPLAPGGGRKSTLEAWHRQGLPAGVEDIPEYAYRQAGGALEWPKGGPGFRVNERMIPHVRGEGHRAQGALADRPGLEREHLRDRQ